MGKKKKTTVEIYENTLVNIWKLAAQIKVGKRWCWDSSYVAGIAIKEANPKLYRQLNSLLYEHMSVSVSGKVTWPKKITKNMRVR